MATSELVRIVRSSSGRLSSNAYAMPVNLGRVEDAAPTTATLRAGRRSPIETKAAPMCLNGTTRGHNDTRVGMLLPTGLYAASPLVTWICWIYTGDGIDGI